MFAVSDLNKNFGGSMDLAQKRHGSADLHTPIHPPLQGKAKVKNSINGSTFFCSSNIGRFGIVQYYQIRPRLFKKRITLSSG